MRTLRLFGVLTAASLLLAACGASDQNDKLGEVDPVSDASQGASQADASGSVTWSDQSPRQDAQGAVTLVITPLNLSQPGETIDFEVSLDTHSIDLNMDLATSATLTTDTGLSVNAMLWDGERGGHHVGGILSFPAVLNNLSVLDGATELTLVIRNVDAAERTFTWSK